MTEEGASVDAQPSSEAYERDVASGGEADGSLEIAQFASQSAMPEREAPDPSEPSRGWILEDASGRDARARASLVAARTGSSTTPPTTANPTPAQSATATDAPVQRDLIIYSAQFVLAIYEVDATQRALADAAREAGGHVDALDSRSITLRVPADRFEAFLATVEGTGQVVDRRLQAQDVGEQFRDLQIRLANLTAMRDRLEQMLQRAATVQEALAVERELERITVELESLRGRLRYLADRVSFSTITVSFDVLRRDPITADAPSQLPVRWLRTLGLSNLLRN